MNNTDYLQVFKPNESSKTKDEMIFGALDCLEKFGDAFNNGDQAGMDDQLHFPHTLITGEKSIIWDKPGQLPSTFFDDLKVQGWRNTEVIYQTPILVSTNKVHFKVKYTRNHIDGSVMSEHENIWILTFMNDNWKILLRSY
ncbi:MAG: hypothetical protein OCC49_19720 [Fibrobacterales bacterium]